MQGYQASGGLNRPLMPMFKKVIEKETFKLKPMTGEKIKLFNNLDVTNAIQIPKLSF